MRQNLLLQRGVVYIVLSARDSTLAVDVVKPRFGWVEIASFDTRDADVLKRILADLPFWYERAIEHLFQD